MKKLYYIAALAAIGLASCTSEEEVRQSEPAKSITFKAVSQKATRGPLTEAALPEKAPIYVYGIHHGDAETPETLLDNLAFTCTNYTSKTWGNNAAIYPLTGKLDFVSYAFLNYDATATDKLLDPKTPAASITVGGTSKQIDKLVLAFSGENTLDGATDVMYSNRIEGQERTSPVPNLNFNHSQARIVLNFLDPGNTDDLYMIKDVEVGGVHLNGTCTITYDNTTGEGTPEWTGMPAEKTSYTFGKFQEKTLKDASGKDLIGVLVIPGDQGTISFKYAVKKAKTTSGTTDNYSDWNTYEIDLNKTIDPATPTATKNEWKRGLVYTYNISFNAGSKITFTTSVEAWKTGYSANGSASIGEEATSGSGSGSSSDPGTGGGSGPGTGGSSDPSAGV